MSASKQPCFPPSLNYERFDLTPYQDSDYFSSYFPHIFQSDYFNVSAGNFTVDPDHSLFSLTTSVGPTTENALLGIFGDGFLPAQAEGQALCRFDAVWSVAAVFNTTYLECRIPANLPSLVYVDVTMNAQGFTLNPLPFRQLSSTITYMFPTHGPVGFASTITFNCTNCFFAPDGDTVSGAGSRDFGYMCSFDSTEACGRWPDCTEPSLLLTTPATHLAMCARTPPPQRRTRTPTHYA